MTRVGVPASLTIEAHVHDPRSGLSVEERAAVEEAHRAFVYGRICFWAGSQRVGDDSTEVSLSTVTASCRGLLRSRGRRGSSELMAMSATSCFQAIDDALYRDDPEQSDEAVAARVAEHKRFVGLPRGEDAFYEYKAYIVESGAEARYLWARLDDERVVHELRLRAGEFDALLDEFVAWFEAVRPR